MIEYYQLDVVTRHRPDFTPYPFIGSMLRGAFGEALKETVCILPRKVCQGCSAQQTCLFYHFYERPNTTPNYRFDYVLYPGKLDFSLLLFGKNMGVHLPYVISALLRMVEKTGVGTERVLHTVTEIRCNSRLFYDGNRFLQIPFESKTFRCDSPKSDRYDILLETPFRIKHNNRFLREGIPSLDVLLQSIFDRRAKIFGEEKRRLPLMGGEIVDQWVVFEDFGRYSNKQKTKMLFGGLLGRVSVEELDEQSYQLLRLGELIGVGKSTVFGLGKITLEEVA